MAVAVFRIFQESLTNITKHGACLARLGPAGYHAGSISGRQLELEVRDNGCGIMPSDLAKLNSFGIRGMVERAGLLGGKLTVSGSAGDRGTIVRLSIPLGRIERRSQQSIAV